jgi:mannose-6-phosphate isomerase-like protein (cupin superfamily)
VINEKEQELKDNFVIIIPPGTYHNIKNISNVNDAKLYTIYSPPEHSPDCVEIKKEQHCESKQNYYDTAKAAYHDLSKK